MKWQPEQDGQVPTSVLGFLSQPESYPERPSGVQKIETHMSWVFLLNRHVYKLKKPVLRPFLDFRSLAARRRFCQEEVRLNRKLAPDVYLGAVPLTESDDQLAVNGGGKVIDWLVRMRRLPADRMLDRVILAGGPSHAELDRLNHLLVGFYRAAPRRRLAPEAYVARLRQEIALNRLDLIDPSRSPLTGLARFVSTMHLQFIALHLSLLRERAARISEVHGDLRPEHLCLEPKPVAIDRLEFKPMFRYLDPVDELCYLAMECERLGAERLGSRLLHEYSTGLGDRVPESLIAFYKGLRACQRARLAVLHLNAGSSAVIRARWIGRASEYLGLAARYGGSVLTPHPRIDHSSMQGTMRPTCSYLA